MTLHALTLEISSFIHSAKNHELMDKAQALIDFLNGDPACPSFASSAPFRQDHFPALVPARHVEMLAIPFHQHRRLLFQSFL